MNANWLVERMDKSGIACIVNQQDGEAVEMDEFEASARKLLELRGSSALEERLETNSGTVVTSLRFTAALDVAIAVLRERSQTWPA